MALDTGALIQDFDDSGLADCIAFTPTGSLDLADGAFSSSVAVTETEIDNSVILATMVRFVLKPMDGWTGTIDAGAVVSIYFQITEVDGTNAAPEPDSNNPNTYMGNFDIDVNHTTEPVQAVCSMNGIKKCKVFIKNETGASLDDDNTNGWEVEYELFSINTK